MKRIFTLRDLPFLLLSFVVPLVCFLLTSSSSLMFDDAAEFALVIKLGSIAHPPGTPAYILAGMTWTTITGIFGMNIINAMNVFSALCISFSSLLLYCSFKIISVNILKEDSIKNLLICCLIAVSYATGATTWAWGNTVEVYSFQVIAMAVAFYGLTYYHFSGKLIAIWIAALGLALGLCNHHLTMILFLPFTTVFFLKDIFIREDVVSKKKRTKDQGKSFARQLISVLTMPHFLLLAGVTLGITCFFYGWMSYRAQSIYPFMFGKPDTLSELYYHISGGVYSKNITSTSASIISSRVPFFLKLTFFQLFLFTPLFIAGIIILIKRKLFRLMWMILLYYIFLFIYQVNNNQWSSTDAYMLLPFLILTIPVLYGAIYYLDKFKLVYVIPVLLCIQIAYNYPINNKKSYPVSESLMELLDKSAPPNSIIIISDWTTVIQYYYYRIAENFRPDLVVLNSDIKFTHYKILPTLYPQFYSKIKNEYDTFIKDLTAEHPHQAVNTGCDLSTITLVNDFKTLITKMESIAASEHHQFLTDPQAHYFYSTHKYYNPKRFVSGCFSSSLPGDSTANDFFIDMNFPFLKSDLIYNDPAALDKLVDFQAMLDWHIEFYKANADVNRLARAETAHDKIIKMQKEMKKSMSFAYMLK